MPDDNDIDLSDVLGAVLALQKSQSEGFKAVSEQLSIAAEERQAMREVIDTLPTFDQVADLEKQAAETKYAVAGVERQLSKVHSEQGRIVTELKKAGLKI